MGYFLLDLRAFGINADQWTTEAQDGGEWRKTVKPGREIHAEIDRRRENQGWNYATQ